MRKEERKEKRPRKNVRPSPPNHYQPINYSSPLVSPPSPPYPISSCAATRPLLPSRPPQTEHQRRQSSSLPRPPPDGAMAPPLLLPAGRRGGGAAQAQHCRRRQVQHHLAIADRFSSSFSLLPPSIPS